MILLKGPSETEARPKIFAPRQSKLTGRFTVQTERGVRHRSISGRFLGFLEGDSRISPGAAHSLKKVQSPLIFRRTT